MYAAAYPKPGHWSSAAMPQKAARQDAAFGEDVEPVPHKLRQVGPGDDCGLGKEVSGVQLHQSVLRGLLESVAQVVNRRALRRPLRLPADGLPARL